MINYVCALKIDKSILVLIKGLIFLLPMMIYGWEPPIGIPRPEFGIDETHEMYKGKMFSFSTGTKKYPETANGPYTHYIDSSSSNATDKNNPYGSPDIPRITMPLKLEAGSIVEIHGELGNVSSQIEISFNGTESKPVFIRGVSKKESPIIRNKKILLIGSFCIIENLEFSGTRVDIRTPLTGVETHHVAIRNIYLHSVTSTAFMATSLDTVKRTNNIVYYNNILQGGMSVKGDFKELDGCGIYMGIRSDKVWIVDNTICNFPGDAVGGGHGANYSVTNYYVGRNNLHTCGENAVDVKEVENVIISQNKMHNMQGWSGGSDGTGIVVHYGPNVSSKNVWIIYNEIFECTDKGIQMGGDQIYDVYIIGNLVHDIKNDSGSACGYRTWSCRTIHLINNTFYNVDIGIKSDISSNGGVLVFQNNLLSNVKSQFVTMSGTDHLKNSILSNNLFHNFVDNTNKNTIDLETRFSWGGQKYQRLDQFQFNTQKCDNCIQVKQNVKSIPKYGENALSYLNKGDCIDNGSDSIYASYASLFKDVFNFKNDKDPSLDKDFVGNQRFFDGNQDGKNRIDIGCYEYYEYNGQENQVISRWLPKSIRLK